MCFLKILCSDLILCKVTLTGSHSGEEAASFNLYASCIPQVETQRLLLRGLREEDLDAYAEMCGDPEVMRYIGTRKPLSRWESWRNMAMILGHWQLRGYGIWAVEERQSSEMIGRIGCWQPEGWPGLEIGAFIAASLLAYLLE